MKTKIAGVALAAVMACGWAGEAKASVVTLHFSGTYTPKYGDGTIPNPFPTVSGSLTGVAIFSDFGGNLSHIPTPDNPQSDKYVEDDFGKVSIQASGLPDLPTGNVPEFNTFIYISADNVNIFSYAGGPIGFSAEFSANPTKRMPIHTPGYDLGDFTFDPQSINNNGFIVSYAVRPISTGLYYNQSYSVQLTSFYFDKGSIVDVSNVPLPASAPLFGIALLGLAAKGYGTRRKRAP